MAWLTYYFVLILAPTGMAMGLLGAKFVEVLAAYAIVCAVVAACMVASYIGGGGGNYAAVGFLETYALLSSYAAVPCVPIISLILRVAGILR